MGETNKTNSYTEFFYKAFRNILIVGIPLVIISALILGFSVSHSSATGSNSNSGSDSVTLTLSTSCTLSSSVITPHHASLNGGQYEEGIGNTRINTYCNDNNGYSIYAIGTSNNIDGNTDLVSNLDEHYNIHTGAYANGDNIDTSTPSFWGMKLIPGIGTGSSSELTPPTIMNSYNSYNVVPSSYTLVASRTSGTNMTIDTNITGSYFNTTYNIYASSVQPAGSYEGKVKYVMVHPNSNSHNTIPDIDTAFAAAGKMKVYEEGGKSYYAMQDMDSQICSFVANTGASTATQLVDIRDNNLYWVAKLDDGKCWMTSNLDLDIGGTGVAALTSENTDISTTASGSGIYVDGYTVNNGVWTWTPTSTAITANTHITYPNTGTITVSPAWPINNYTTPYSAEGGDTYYYTSNSTNNDTRYNSLQACKASHTEAECKRYFAGNYYNWTAAIASNNSTDISTTGAIAANSICPKGWRLPSTSQTNNINNEFGIMLYKAGITVNLSAGGESVGYKDSGFNKLRSNPYYFVRSGYIYNGSLGDPTVLGRYWSSTVSSGANAYDLSFNNTDIYLTRNYGRYNGRSVRCVAR